MALPRALLVALRDAHDPMCQHEHQCFAERAKLPLDHVHVHSMTAGRPTTAELRSFDAIFFGGSGAYSVLDDVSWIKEGLSVLLEVVELRKKAWASCFGFQGLSLAMGGRVIHDDALTEMGSTWLELTPEGEADPIVSVLPKGFWAQEGHHDHVMGLPPGVTLLATGSQVRLQAFKVDGAPFYASQFHPELTVPRTLERFRHYQAHYVDDVAQGADDMAAKLVSGQDTREMGEVLARLVRA